MEGSDDGAGKCDNGQSRILQKIRYRNKWAMLLYYLKSFPFTILSLKKITNNKIGINLIIAIVATEGSKIGMRILNIMVIRCAPSIWAVSSIVTGIWLINALKVSTVKGIKLLVYSNINPGKLSICFKSRNIWKESYWPSASKMKK